MFRKLLNYFLMLALVLTMLPLYPSGSQAAGESFIFSNLPTAVNSNRISLSGTINNIAPTGITYTVERMSSKDSNATVLEKRDKSALGINVSTDGTQISVINLPLYPGLNRITFYGLRGASEIKQALPLIEYVDAPILYDLAILGNSNQLPLSDAKLNVVTNDYASNTAKGLFTIQGKAPNAREVMVLFGNNESRSTPVREDGSDSFILNQVKLKKGKNLLKFIVKNNTQNVEVSREVVYFDGSVTFYDVSLQETGNDKHDLSLLSNYFVGQSSEDQPGKFNLSGKVIVPNDFKTSVNEKMRIEAAYRLAGTSGTALSADPVNPDPNDKIVIRFSAPVEGAGDMTAADLNAFLKFYNGSSYITLTDSTGKWKTSTVNGVNRNNTQLEISIGSADSTALANVFSFELVTDVVTAGDSGNKISMTGPDYLKRAVLAGSFDHTHPYVTEAYVKANAATGSTRGVDPGEQIIVKLQDSIPSYLFAGNATNYSMSRIDTMINLQKDDGTTMTSTGGMKDSASGASAQYSMLYNGSAKQLEITFNKATGLNDQLTKHRSDEGVGNTSSTYINLLQLIKPDGTPLSSTTPVFNGGANVLIGGTFHGDGLTANPDPDNLDPTIARAIYYGQNMTELGRHFFNLKKIDGVTYSDSDPYFVFDFAFNGDASTTDGYIPNAFPSGSLNFNGNRYIQLEAFDSKKSRTSGGATLYTGTEQTDLGYNLKSNSAPYIESVKVNTAEEYPATEAKLNKTASSLTDGMTINKLPFAVKLTIPKGTTLTGTPEVRSKKQESDSFPSSSNVAVDSTKIFDTGVTKDPREVWFWITKLPFDGSQTLQIKFDSLTTTVNINLVSGVFVKFEGITENTVIQYDPTDDSNSSAIIENKLKDFKGTISNVAASDLVYSGSNQNVFLYVNNTPIPIIEKSSTEKNSFGLDLTSSSIPGSSDKAKREAIRDYFIDGQNTLRILYKGKDDNGKETIRYEKNYTITFFSINLPEIPKKGEEIYPYGTDKDKPEKDKRFNGANGSYTTKEADMNIAGSFDFINLGSTASQITDNRSKSSIAAGQYKLVIKGGLDNKTWEWDLKTNRFTDKDGRSYSGTDPTTGLSVTYQNNSDPDKQYFTFVLKNQKLPADGSKVVYNFYVYNNFESGNSVASYRLEVGTSGIPYKLLRPILPQQATMNQNYVEVVIYAEGADKVVVNKEEAEPYDFDGNYDGKMNDIDDGIDYHAFKAIVKGLKPNKSNKITFTITRGKDTITDSFDIFYALANMPGAQYLEEMKPSHKVFDGKLNLTFPKDTYLRRIDYSVPENLRTQLFKGHNILFAIANSKDGVVDRYDYVDPKPKNFKRLVDELGVRFDSSYDKHFVKASEVYWIDGGLADDPDTDAYDPVTSGILPHQLGDLPSYDRVPSNRVLVPNKRGTLELAYDPNIVSGAGNNITVMRFDSEYQYWENLGGQINASKHTIKIPFDRFGYYVVSKLNDSFQDVSRHPYARNHVEAMYSKGVIKPKREGDFGVDDNTTRAEFTTMVVRALQLPLVDKPAYPSFDDVPTVIDQSALWDYRYIETASRLGLIRGTSPRIFEPNGRITREEASVILARALQLKLETVGTKVDKDLQKLFKDFTLINDYAKPSVLAIAKKKFIVGSPIDINDPKKGYTFDPNANMLRGDAAILIARVMADQKLIPAVGEVK